MTPTRRGASQSAAAWLRVAASSSSQSASKEVGCAGNAKTTSACSGYALRSSMAIFINTFNHSRKNGLQSRRLPNCQLGLPILEFPPTRQSFPNDLEKRFYDAISFRDRDF